MTARKADPDAVEVVVTGNFQVSHDGRVYGPGESVRVPAPVAERWAAAGYVRRS